MAAVLDPRWGRVLNLPESTRDAELMTAGGVARDVTVAEERIERLHALAREAAADGDDERARSYVRRARRVAERNRLPLPCRFRRFTCDRCDAYLRPGKNARVRLQDGHVVVTCDCGEQARYPYE
jgi:ribonuclease P protein subunit RPR2